MQLHSYMNASKLVYKAYKYLPKNKHHYHQVDALASHNYAYMVKFSGNSTELDFFSPSISQQVRTTEWVDLIKEASFEYPSSVKRLGLSSTQQPVEKC